MNSPSESRGGQDHVGPPQADSLSYTRTTSPASHSPSDSRDRDTQADNDTSSSAPRGESTRSKAIKRPRAIARYWAIAVTLVGLLAGIAQIFGVSVTSLMSHLTSASVPVGSAHKPSLSPDQQTVTGQTRQPKMRSHSSSPRQPTYDELQRMLLRPSDYAGIDTSFVAKSIQPQSKVCDHILTRPLVSAATQLIDNTEYDLIIAEQVDVFSSIQSAQSAFAASSPHLGCSFRTVKTDITSEVQGFCPQARAVKYYSPTSNQETGSYYIAEIRCGRALIRLAVGTIKGLPSDDVSNLFFSVETALPKVRSIE